jgi:two-component system sensor histidine kinase HydH
MAGMTYLTKTKYDKLSKQIKKTVDETGIREMLATAQEQIYYMDKIVSDLQDYSAPLTPILLQTDVRELVRKTVAATRLPRNVKVVITTGRYTRKVELDEGMMRRVFTNLVSNAIQAMPKGGRLAIKTSTTGRDLTVSFRDTGVGITGENLPKIFSPFFTTKAKGQGLGLSVCKRLVEAQGGTITVQSQVGKGSTFTVRFPLKRP